MKSYPIPLLCIVLSGPCLFPLLPVTTSVADEPAGNTFAFPIKQLIHASEDFGIVNGKMTVGIENTELARISGIFAPPFVSSDFRFDCTVNGKPVAGSGQGVWWPNRVYLNGYIPDLPGLSVSSDARLLYERRAMVIDIMIRSPRVPRTLSLEGSVSGTLDINNTWEFARPKSESPTLPEIAGGSGHLLVLGQTDSAIVVGSETRIQWNADSRRWSYTVKCEADKLETIRFVVTIGPRDDAVATCRELLADSRATSGNVQLEDRVQSYLSTLPRFTCDNRELQQLYYRSLAHGFLNRWEVPEFLLNPYYSTGSIRGGCLCNYLWNFGEIWEIMPMIDPTALKAHIKHFLSIDLTKHFAFLPITGEGFGPWYMVNQEKIIGLVYYYVLTTGDTAFLVDTVGGKSILELVLHHATVLDELSKPVALIDYGPSNSHLELRKELTYNHVMPDLNGRRYNNYVFASRLSELMGKPRPDLIERAEQLRVVLNRELWDTHAKWFAFRKPNGDKELRYTVQMFKLFNSGVLTQETEAGLLSHLNSTEFLGDYGLHSLAKGDPAYDINDVDNGGPGACTCFPPQIAERLYKAGHVQQAHDIIRRILWWGQQMPYWGDSIYADKPDYRKDTPLQCTIDGLTVAQCIIFGMFGIAPKIDGSITVKPSRPSFVNSMSLEGVRIVGTSFDVHVGADTFSVTAGGVTTKTPLGDEVHVTTP